MRTAAATLLGLALLGGCTAVERVDLVSTDYEACADPAADRLRDALRKGDRAAVRTAATAAVRACPNFVPAHLALIDNARGEDGKVDREIERFYAEFPWPERSAVAELVRSRLATNDRDRVAALEAALDRDRSFYFAYLDLAAVWSQNDRLAKVLESYEKAVQAKPDSWRGNLGLARILHQIGRGEDAAPRYERALELLSPDTVERGAAIREYVRLMLYELRRPSQTLPLLEELLATAPDDVALLMDRAAAAWILGERDRAAATYRRVLELDPGEFRAALSIGNLFFQRPDCTAEVQRRDWPRARLAYRYFLDHAEDGDPYDLMDKFVTVPCRLQIIDAALGMLPAAAPRPRVGDF